MDNDDKHGITNQNESAALFDRVVSILEQARGNVVRAVNSNMVLAYWLIGREIVQELQGGDERAGYGKKIIETLSTQLTEKYGKGFSATTLWNFRLFYQVYSNRKKMKRLRPCSMTSGAVMPALNWRCCGITGL